MRGGVVGEKNRVSPCIDAIVELVARGEPVTYAGVLSVICGRDERDMNRAASPMKPAADAHLLDTTQLDVEAAFAAAVLLIEQNAHI